MNINSLTDLYERLLPALDTKCQEFKDKKINISCINLWNFLMNKLWRNKTNLKLYEMVNDIMNVNLNDIITYLNNNGGTNEN